MALSAGSQRATPRAIPFSVDGCGYPRAMQARPDADEGLWGRLLLAAMGMAFVIVGLLASAMMTFDEDAGRHDGFYGLAMAGIGAVALTGAAIGRALGRWVLAGLGLLLLAHATEIGLDLVSYRGAPSRFTMLVLAVLVLSGLAAIGVAAGQIVGHRKRTRDVSVGTKPVEGRG